MKILVTGGAGFIGSSVIRHLLLDRNDEVVNIDSLTYAGNLESLTDLSQNDLYCFYQKNICHYEDIMQLFMDVRPDAVMHLAAESHVDRSIDGPGEFIQTNIVGTYTLLQAALKYWNSLEQKKRSNFIFHHISTDEVYGSLGSEGLFHENSPYSPNSPYSASKASSDHLVRAWHETFGFPTLITNCSNNYGPYQFPEKLIPVVILNALAGNPIPIYGEGNQIRDWLYVEDHARALRIVLEKGKAGETYNIGGHNEIKNIDVVHTICEILEDLVPQKPTGVEKYIDLIEHVKDRPGHDQRYAINATKIQQELGWEPTETFSTGIRKTVQWYLENQQWLSRILDGSYRRIGLGGD